MTTPALQALAQDVNKYRERVTAKYNGQIVAVDLQSSLLDETGHCTIRGDFGDYRTHTGDEQPCRCLVVPIAELTNLVMQDANGNMIQAKG